MRDILLAVGYRTANAKSVHTQFNKFKLDWLETTCISCNGVRLISDGLETDFSRLLEISRGRDLSRDFNISGGPRDWDRYWNHKQLVSRHLEISGDRYRSPDFDISDGPLFPFHPLSLEVPNLEVGYQDWYQGLNKIKRPGRVYGLFACVYISDKWLTMNAMQNVEYSRNVVTR